MIKALILLLAVLVLVIIRLYLYREDFVFQNDHTTWFKRNWLRLKHGFLDWINDETFHMDIIILIVVVSFLAFVIFAR